MSKKACVFCKGPHPSVCCDTILDPQKQLDIVKKGKYSFNCLGHHKVSQCQSKSSLSRPVDVKHPHILRYTNCVLHRNECTAAVRRTNNEFESNLV